MEENPRKQGKIPEDWRETTFGEVVRSVAINDKKLPRKQYAASGKFPVVDQGQEFIGGYSDDAGRVVDKDLPLIIFGDHTRIFKFLNCPFVPGADGVKVLKPLGVDEKWLYHIAHALEFPDKGYARHFQHLKKARLLVPPLPEQRRIVARIEALFSRLDAGVAALCQAKAQLKRYRQSVLAAAVTGELTREWREAQKTEGSKRETGEELLKRILKQRREQWIGKRKYKEPPVPVTDDLPELPPSWTWATVAQQADPDERSITDGPFGSKLKSSHYTESGPRVLRLQNIGDGVFKDEYAHISEEHFKTLTNHQIFAGDLLIRALGIPPHQTCRIPEGVGPAIVKADCIRFKVFEPLIDPKFTLLALNSHPVRIRTEKHIHGVGRPRLNGTEIKRIALPQPPTAEQHQIVAEVEARTTAIYHLEAELDRQITRSNRLRQSTLASAFNGKLSQNKKSNGIQI